MQSAIKAPITGRCGPIYCTATQALESQRWQHQRQGRKTTNDLFKDHTSKTSSIDTLLQQIHNHAGEGNIFTQSEKFGGLMHALGKDDRELLYLTRSRLRLRSRRFLKTLSRTTKAKNH
jgi:hypothetical protein